MSDSTVPFLRDPAFRQLLQDVRQTDNWRNWWYIARTWLFLAAVIAAAVAGMEWIAASGIGWGWSVLVAVPAIVLIGAGQHHLGVLGHEGSHRTLFRNRWLNELASDWLCMFPIFSATYMYRLQHLAHHQFVNDPDRDPNVVQMRSTDTWPDGPMTPRQVVLYVLRLFWLPQLLRFLSPRIRDNSMGGDHDVYRPADGPAPPSWPRKFGAASILALLGLNVWLAYRGDAALLAIVPTTVWLVALAVFAWLPERMYYRSRVRPEFSMRSLTIQRFVFYFAVFHGLAWVMLLTGVPALVYFLVLWMGSLLTAFPLYLVLRQLVQHGNGGRGRLDNTRVFLRPVTVNFFLLPLGQDYHLPHHLFASVPHYRLRRLHEAMLVYPDYKSVAVEVDGLIHPPAGTGRRSIVGALGDTPAGAEEKFIDSSVLDEYQVEERDAIRAEEKASAS
ncbi:MAG TPA: fatty acid desaturase [Gemmataceae bacterium]|nr:fatty acid desaturase [Gemmataceae bacterium]